MATAKKTIFSPYPFPLPASVLTAKAAILGTAGYYSIANKLKGEYARYHVKLGSQVIWSSQLYRLADVPVNFRIPVPSTRRDYRVYLEFLEYFDSKGNSRGSWVRYPFNFSIEERQGNIQPIIKLSTDRASSKRTLRSARSRSTRNKIPRAKRQWTPKSQAPNNPVVASVGLPRGSFFNGNQTQSGTDIVETYRRSWSGTVTPGYFKLKKRRALPVNSYTMSLTRTKDGGYFEQLTSPGGSSFAYGRYPQGSSQYGSVLGQASSLGTVLDFKAQRRLRDAVGPSANWAQNVAQINQTTKLITDTAMRLGDAIQHTRNKNYAAAARSLFNEATPRYRSGRKPNTSKSLSDNWLAFQYGWKPLLKDIDEGMDALARYINQTPNLVWTARASASRKDSIQTRCFRNISPFPTTGTVITNTKWQVRYGMRYKIASPLRTFLSQTGFTNPITLAWELLPYSFVVDWFIPIGAFADALTAWDGLELIDGWKTEVIERDSTCDVFYGGLNDPLDNSPDPAFLVFGGNLRREYVTYTRTKLTSFPTLPTPSFKSPFDKHGQHISNALALMGSKFFLPEKNKKGRYAF